eukprot:CAMPEP_0117553978 /NCGR_PEP_ID=MMETSP0784-20121206/50511_1 /TAXON_ID=39447 /ORGANISM="" /LENGTH=41 /DNA_ID= /DNA_START= /DNA_END= /DNA_ORIENTATION=
MVWLSACVSFDSGHVVLATSTFSDSNIAEDGTLSCSACSSC